MNIVVLAVIFLDLKKHPAAAEGIPVFVDEPTGCTGIFKFLWLKIGPDLGLACPYHFILVHNLYNRFYPIFGDFNI